MRVAAGLGLLLLGACGSNADTTHALFVVGDAPVGPDDDFYSLPFPNDLHRKADGTLDLSTFPVNSLIADSYRAAAEELDGFGVNPTVFARFDGALDPASLPDAAGSVAAGASVYLVDVDPDSPAHGTRVPIEVRFRAERTQTLGENQIVARTYPGFGLADGTTYALVVTSRVRAAAGDLAPADAFRDLLADAGDPAAHDAYAPLLAYLDEPGDDERADVITAAVFTTQHATAIVPALRAAIFATAAPTATGVVNKGANATFTTFEGAYTAPNFQTGDVPYRDAPTGRIVVGADGNAVVQRMEPMRFALTVPPGATPAGGWPLAIYAHGTGGDYRSFIDDGTAGALAQQGIATISTDQVLHGPRNPGGNPELDFFNVGNPYAMRDNVLQGAADAFSQLRLGVGLSIADGNRTITVDATKVFFFGHSQGGVTGPGFVAFEPTLSGAVLSGTGGVLYLALLHKTQPLDVPSLVATFIRDEPLDEDNPSLALFQMWADRSDGANYAPLMVRSPAPGIAPRNIFQTEGFTDSYTPNPAIEAFATAIGGDLVMLPDEQDVPGLTQLRGRGVMTTPVAGNLDGATAVLAQYDQQAGSDGHFVVFDIPLARDQAAAFLGTLARTGTATVVPGP
jgi:hypothetical protein